MVKKHVGDVGVILCVVDGVYPDGQLCVVKAALSLSAAVDAGFTCLGNVPWVYEHDSHLLYLKSDGADEFPAGARFGVFGRSGAVVLYMQGFF